MKLTLPRKDLSAALGVVKTAAARAGSLPILSNVALVANAKSVTLSATDLDVHLRLRTDAGVKDEGKTTVRAHLLADIAAATTSETITLELKKNTLHVNAGESKFELATLDMDEFPPFPTVKEPVELDVAEAELRAALAATVFAISSDESRYILNGTLLEFNEGKLNVVATDGRRIARKTIEVEGADKLRFILPAKAVKELLRLLNSDTDQPGRVQIKAGKNQAEFRFGDVVLVTKLIEGEYPNYGQIIPAADTFTPIGRADLLGCVERVNLVADAVTLELGGGSIGIKSCATGEKKDQTGKAADALLCPCKQTVSVSLATRYLMDGLKASSAEEVQMFVATSGLALFEVPADQWLCVIAALKPN